jgi:uncharacterized protein (TIGR02145 family)
MIPSPHKNFSNFKFYNKRSRSEQSFLNEYIVKASHFFKTVFKIAIIIPLLFAGCERQKLPKLTTTEVTEIEPTCAVTGGNITHDGNSDIIVRGVVWGTGKSPEIDGPRTTDGYGTGSFVTKLCGLEPNTLYYVRAYAINNVGTAYGNELSFTTIENSVPILTTDAVSSITQTSAVAGGTITSDGGSAIEQRGVCWSTSPMPDTEDNVVNAASGGTGKFTCPITGLTGNSKYYVRAFATNYEGTAYGQETSFTTSPVLPSVTTTAPRPASTSTGTSGGNVTDNGGSPVTVRGVCWSTSQNPTVEDHFTENGEGNGSFTSSITELAPNTTYHVRAYATNDVGTAYGSDRTFTTDPLTVTDRDGNVYHVIRIGSQLWFKENLKTTTFSNGNSIPHVSNGSAWSTLTDPGYCWYNNNDGNKDVYGALYNWYAVETGNLCPTGWRVPSDDDCLALEKYDGNNESTIGGKLKEEGTEHWTSPNTGATDEWGFTALPGGHRTASGLFDNIRDHGQWWTSTVYSETDAWGRRLQYNEVKTFRFFVNKKTGKSIRCMKD